MIKLIENHFSKTIRSKLYHHFCLTCQVYQLNSVFSYIQKRNCCLLLLTNLHSITKMVNSDLRSTELGRIRNLDCNQQSNKYKNYAINFCFPLFSERSREGGGRGGARWGGRGGGGGVLCLLWKANPFPAVIRLKLCVQASYHDLRNHGPCKRDIAQAIPVNNTYTERKVISMESATCRT